MRGFRLFEKPLGVFSPFPPLYISGVLPAYEPGAPYENRLQFHNNIGKCHVEIVWEDSHLPPGSHAHVDNFTNEIVVTWPAYSPPEEEKPGILNWDFQLETLEGWNDLRGNSWGVEDSTVHNAAWATPGNFVAAMRGVGRGEHVLESIPYPVDPGQSVMARSLWDQGPSNKDNNNLWTALAFWRNGTFIEERRGDRIHDRTNKSRHWSTINTTAPTIATDVTVRLIAGRRNGRNRVILVDTVETSGLSYTVGTNVDDDYFIRLKLTDSANRVAYFEQLLTIYSTFYVSNLYPLETQEELGVSGRFDTGYTLPTPMPLDNMGVQGTFLSAELVTLVNYLSYTDGQPESLSVSGSFRSGDLVTLVGYKTYNDGLPESIGVQGSFHSADIAVVANYLSYTDGQPESLGVSGSFHSAVFT